MTVLIAKANESIFTKIDSNLKFTESTKNTSTFNVTPKKFESIRNAIRELGYNPYAIMSW